MKVVQKQEFTVTSFFDLPQGTHVTLSYGGFYGDAAYHLQARSDVSVEDATERLIKAAKAIAESIEGVQLRVVS